MKAIYSVHDHPDTATAIGMNMALADVQVPTPGAHDLLVKVDYAGINRADTVQAAGHYPPPAGASPILGLEVAGIVVDVGGDVSGIEVGDAVCSLVKGGGYADYALVPEAFAMPIPKDYSIKEAASIVEAVVTSYYTLVDRLNVQSGDRVLIHGGSGAVGSIAIQMANLLGARVMTTAGSATRCRAVERITDCVAFDYHDDVAAAVREATDGHGADAIIDISGAAGMDNNQRAMAYGASMMVLGVQKGARAQVNLAQLMSNAGTIMSGTVRNLPAQRYVDLRDRVVEVAWPWLDDKRIVPVIDRCFSIAQADEAHRNLLGYDLVDGDKQPLDTDRVFGKILLRLKD